MTEGTVKIATQQVLQQKIIVEQITMRDQFAMAALTGMISDPNGLDYYSIPKKAYEMADAMLKARKEKK